MNHELDLTDAETAVVTFGDGWDYVQGTGDVQPMIRELLLTRPYSSN